MNKMGHRKFDSSEFNQVMGAVNIFEAIEKFREEQISLGDQSILHKLSPREDSQVSHTLSQFVRYCMPEFLIGQKNIYEKILYEKMTQAK
jgi:hypothetical protein